MPFIEDTEWLDSIYKEYPDKFRWSGFRTIGFLYNDNEDIEWPIMGHLPDHVMEELQELYRKMLAKYTEGTK